MTAKTQKVEVKRGDYRGGAHRPAGDAARSSGQLGRLSRRRRAGHRLRDAGVGASARELAALATDTWGCEVRPNETEPGINQPWHWITIPIMGMTMGEIFNVKELAEDCAADGVYEYLFVAPGAAHHRRGRLARQSAGDQVGWVERSEDPTHREASCVGSALRLTQPTGWRQGP